LKKKKKKNSFSQKPKIAKKLFSCEMKAKKSVHTTWFVLVCFSTDARKLWKCWSICCYRHIRTISKIKTRANSQRKSHFCVYLLTLLLAQQKKTSIKNLHNPWDFSSEKHFILMYRLMHFMFCRLYAIHQESY
jgi:hypothetical protein